MRRDKPVRNTAVFLGALAPDLSIFVMYAWARLVEGLSASEVWRVLYWQEPWQTLSAISNSIPLWAMATALGLAVRQPIVFALGAAGLLHVSLDFPVHAGDAHVHFWPITDWRFHSPLSYWDARHFGHVIAPLEAMLGVVLSVLIWRRFRSLWVRTLLVISASAYVLVPLYFIGSIHG